ncbi:MAG: hypothetical protein AAF412_01315 [Pseudomonadota bacterium]
MFIRSLLLAILVTFSTMLSATADESKKQRVMLQARLVADGPVLKDGVEWRIFEVDPTASKDLEELVFSFGGTKVFDVDPGEYYVHAAFGHAAAVRKISVTDKALREDFALNAGGLKLNATASENVGIPKRLLRFDIYEEELLEDGNRKLLARNVKPDEVVAFPVGTYHVISRFGDFNATVRADLRVQLGKLTEATMTHRASILTFRLVRQQGGDAVADTSWSVLTENGEVIQESTSTFPTMVLAEGNYTAIAKHNDVVYSQDFEVRSGFNRDVEVLILN